MDYFLYFTIQLNWWLTVQYVSGCNKMVSYCNRADDPFFYLYPTLQSDVSGDYRDILTLIVAYL